MARRRSALAGGAAFVVGLVVALPLASPAVAGPAGVRIDIVAAAIRNVVGFVLGRRFPSKRATRVSVR